jgi:glycerate dehydrogenase
MGSDLNQQALKSSLTSLDIYPNTSRDKVIDRLQGADIAIVNKVILGERELSACQHLKLIAVTATGTNNIDLIAAKTASIKVCNVIQYGRPTIIQHTFSLILALANQLMNYTHDVKMGKWHNSTVFCLMDHPIIELEGKKIGIIGYGDLGAGVAKMAEAFGMSVLLGARPGEATNQVDGYPKLPLTELLPQVDILSLHCLLSADTLNMIDHTELALMKPSAFVINVARGGLINEQALAQALRSGQLAGAATDVLSVEPPINGNVLLDPTIPNLIVTPHCAWASQEARQRLLDKTAKNIEEYINGTLTRVIV